MGGMALPGCEDTWKLGLACGACWLFRGEGINITGGDQHACAAHPGPRDCCTSLPACPTFPSCGSQLTAGLLAFHAAHKLTPHHCPLHQAKQHMPCAPCLLNRCLSCCRPTADLQLMTYRSYLDTFLLPFDMGTGHDVDEYNTRIKHQRNKLKRQFTEEGQAGEMFRCVATRTVGMAPASSLALVNSPRAAVQ